MISRGATIPREVIVEEICAWCFRGDLGSLKKSLESPLYTEGTINGTNSRGQVPLYCAARQGHTEIVRFLLSKEGIEVNAQETHGSTPLHAASYQNHPNCVSLLLSYGAESIPSFTGLYPKQEAQGEAREVWRLFKSGGVELLKAQGYAIFSDHGGAENREVQIKGPLTEIPIQYISDIPPNDIVLQETVHLAVQGRGWKERGVVLWKTAQNENTYRLSCYRSSKGKDRVVEEVALSIFTHAAAAPFGISFELPRTEDGASIFIRGKLASLNFECGEVVMNLPDSNMRRLWLEKLYCLTCSQYTFKRIGIGGDVPRREYFSKWRRYANTSRFLPEPELESQATKTIHHELNDLIREIEAITEVDTYWVVHNELRALTHSLPRGSETRDSILYILSQPRPHEMCDAYSCDSGFNAIRAIRTKLAALEVDPNIQNSMKKSLLELDKVYLDFLNSKGAVPRPVLLRSGVPSIGSRILLQGFVNRITDPHANTDEGIHRVVRVGNVFLKINPTAPAYELAVGALNHYIWHEGTALAIIVKVVLHSQSLVCQAAAAVDGVLLRDVVSIAPDLIPYIDGYNFAVQCLAACLYRPYDGKLDNIMVRCVTHAKSPRLKKLQLICIDNDESFADEFTQSKKGHYTTIRFAVWILPKAGLASSDNSGFLNALAVQRLLESSAEYFVVKLLIFLHQSNERMNSLYDEGVITVDELKGTSISSGSTGLLALFRPGEATRLRGDVNRLQKMLREKPESPFRYLLKGMFPTLYKIYDFAASKVRPTLDNFHDCVDANLYGFGFGTLESIPELNKSYPTLQQELTSYTSSASAYVVDRIRNPLEEIELLLESTDFSALPIKDHEAVLYLISRLPLQCITIRYSKLFSHYHLKEILKHGTLDTLHLIGCSSIGEEAIATARVGALTRSTHQPIHLILEQCILVSPGFLNEIDQDPRLDIEYKDDDGDNVPHTTPVAKGVPTKWAVLHEWVSECALMLGGALLKSMNSFCLTRTEEDVEKVSNSVFMLLETSTPAVVRENVRIGFLQCDVMATAIQYGHITLMEHLLRFFSPSSIHAIDGAEWEYPVPNIRSCYGVNIARNGNLLNDSGSSSISNPRRTNEIQWDWWMCAISYRQEKVFEFLLDHLVVDTPSALILMRKLINAEMYTGASTLLKYHNNLVHVCDGNGNTLLLHCCINYTKKLLPFIQLVLQFDPKSNHWNFDYQTPLHIACGKLSKDLMEVLLSAGSDANLEQCGCDIFGFSPLAFAVSRMKWPADKGFLEYVLEKYKNVDFSSIRSAFQHDNAPEVVGLLLGVSPTVIKDFQRDKTLSEELKKNQEHAHALKNMIDVHLGLIAKES